MHSVLGVQDPLLDCFVKHSLAKVCIKLQYALQLEGYQHLPSQKIGLYKPHMHPRHRNSSNFISYWKPHLLPILQNKHGVQSFEEYTRQKFEDQAQLEASQRSESVSRQNSFNRGAWECP